MKSETQNERKISGSFSKPAPGSPELMRWERILKIERSYPASRDQRKDPKQPDLRLINRKMAAALSDIAFIVESQHQCCAANPPMGLVLPSLFQRVLNELRTTIEQADSKFVLPFAAQDVLRHCVLGFEDPSNTVALKEIRNARYLAWHWEVRTSKSTTANPFVVLLQHGSSRRNEALEVESTADESAPLTSLKLGHNWRTARQVAEAIEHDQDRGGDLKKAWDKLRNFYPKRKGMRGKQTYLYDAEELIFCAKQHGDIREEDLLKIRKHLKLRPIKKSSSPSAKRKIPS